MVEEEEEEELSFSSSERFRPARDADVAAPTAVGGDSLSRSTECRSLATPTTTFGVV